MVLESCVLQTFRRRNKEGICNHPWLGGGYGP